MRRQFKVESEQQHEGVEKKLERHERDLEEMAKRLRRLEIEAGIYKSPLKGANP